MEIIIATTLAFVISVLFLKLAAVPLVMIVIAFTLVMNLYVKFRIGGITGGIWSEKTVIELSETVFLLSVLALERSIPGSI